LKIKLSDGSRLAGAFGSQNSIWYAETGCWGATEQKSSHKQETRLNGEHFKPGADSDGHALIKYWGALASVFSDFHCG
jgi:hypothetical protein